MCGQDEQTVLKLDTGEKLEGAIYTLSYICNIYYIIPLSWFSQ